MEQVHLDAAPLKETPKTPTPQTRLIPVNQWPEHHPWPSVGGLRWMIFNAKSNGFDKALRRVGRRVLIDEAAFFAWVDGQNEGSTQ